MRKFVNKEQAGKLISVLKNSTYELNFDSHKHSIEINTQNKSVSFRLPITILSPDDLTTKVNYVVLLIQSGSCSTGFFEDTKNMNHKVFKSYMVRMKQGTSQIKYLKTKGKSRAGSRVRLGNTVDFFEEINERLQEYFNNNRVDKIALSCSKTLIPYLFNSKTNRPFEKNDHRIIRIPKRIEQPNYEVLIDTQRYLLFGEFNYEESEMDFIQELMANI